MTHAVPRSPKIGFFFWPGSPDLVLQMGRLAEEYGFDMVGVADSPGQCIDCWVAATLLTSAAPSVPVAVSVTNFVSRHWTTTGSAAASLAALHKPGFVLGVGAGHSAVRNFGLTGSTVDELGRDLRAVTGLVRGEPVPSGPGEAQLTWARATPQVFLAASHQRSLRLGGALADGMFVNYGLNPAEIEASSAQVALGADGRPVDVWQVAALDCTDDGDAARAAIGKIVAFGAGYVIGKRDPAERSVPPEHVEAVRELVSLYSTRPSQADTDLVERLGLTEYLTRRLAICGSPADCLAQTRAATAAGASALMFSVAGAADPVAAVELFGRTVLPALRAGRETVDA